MPRATSANLISRSGGGKGGQSDPSEETRQKLREARLGYQHSEETKQKMSDAHVGRTFSVESRIKMGIARTGNKNALGYRATEEHRRNNSLARAGKKQAPEAVETNRRGQHCRGPKAANSTGFKGVSRCRGKRFRARIFVNGKNHVVGYFASVEEAARARDAAALLLIGPDVYLNFPK